MSGYQYGPSANGGGPPPSAFPGPPGAFYGSVPPRGPVFPPHMQAGAIPRMNAPPVMAMHAMAVPYTAPQPARTPLPVGWSEHFTPQGVRYYYNASTGVSTYDVPTAMATTAAAAVTPVASSSSGAAAGSATAAGTPSAAPAVAITWIEYKDDASGLNYYYNTVTKVTTWDQPEEFRMQQARVEVEKMKSSTEANGVIVAEEQRKRDHKKQQADDEALKMYEAMSKDERVAAFKAFLEEKQVSPQFKWQEALRFLSKEGLDKDPCWKFALATVGEKKQAFSEYCTQAVNKQNIERRRQAKRIREEFLELLGNIEGKLLNNRVTWEDVNQGAEFYGLRKDPRWSALEEGKDKKDLFESFAQDVFRKKDQLKAKQVEDFKDTFLAKLREKATQDTVERTFFVGKRRLDGELKKKVWHLVEELDAPKSVSKHDVYDWTESFLDILKAEDSENSKAEREKKKKLEAEFTSKLHAAVDEWLKSERISMNTAWKDISEVIANEISSVGELASVSERRQRRVFEKKMKMEREKVQPVVSVVSQYLALAGFTPTEAMTYEAFSDAVRTGVTKSIESRKPEEGEESPHDEAQASTASRTKSPIALELEAAACASALPLFVKHAFLLLQYTAARSKTREPRDRSRSPSGSRKRRRSSVESPRRTRSTSRHRSRSRSRSRSHSRARRHRSPSLSQDPRAALAMTSYRDLPPSPKQPFQRSAPAAVAPPVLDEAAKAEEIIRQARLKLLAKQEAKQRGNGQESEPEEGEEMEEGEIDE